MRSSNATRVTDADMFGKLTTAVFHKLPICGHVRLSQRWENIPDPIFDHDFPTCFAPCLFFPLNKVSASQRVTFLFLDSVKVYFDVTWSEDKVMNHRANLWLTLNKLAQESMSDQPQLRGVSGFCVGNKVSFQLMIFFWPFQLSRATINDTNGNNKPGFQRENM